MRFATFNASLNRSAEGELAVALASGADPQIAKIAEIIRAVDPDVILVNEFDYGAGNDRSFVASHLGGAYPFSFIAPSNTGVATGLDLDGDGGVGKAAGSFERARDSHGFGTFEGQYGMVVLSKHEIDVEGIRTFRNFRWKDMPGARLPVRPDGSSFYSEDALAILRLSSKSHWDVPIRIGGEVVHLLASHPTPPVFDGPEDRNGLRNADEIRFWKDYIEGADYIRDDEGREGGLARGAHFVIAGDLNADPVDGESVPGAARQLTRHPLVNASVTPQSEGAAAAAVTQGEANARHRGEPRFDTADFRDRAPGQPQGRLRAAFGGPRDRGRRSVLAREGRAGGGAPRRLRPSPRLGRRRHSRSAVEAVVVSADNYRLIEFSTPRGQSAPLGSPSLFFSHPHDSGYPGNGRRRRQRRGGRDQALTKQAATANNSQLRKQSPEHAPMPQTVNIGDAKAQLSHLIARAEAGEDVIIARNGVPAVRIVPLNSPVEEVIALLREERSQRPPVPAADIRAARDQGRG